MLLRNSLFSLAISLGFLSLHANEYWNMVDDRNNLTGWSFVEYTNETSGEIGNFDLSTAGFDVKDTTDNSKDVEGLAGDKAGFLKYTLQNSDNLAGYDQGVMKISYRELSDAVTSFLPSVVMLDGFVGDSRCLLAYEIPVHYGNLSWTEITLSASAFKLVDEFYYVKNGGGGPLIPGDPNEGPLKLEKFTTSGNLTDDEFTAFLGTVDSVLIRNFHDVAGQAVGGINRSHTYITALSLEAAAIPEPATSVFGLLGLSCLFLKRKKAA